MEAELGLTVRPNVEDMLKVRDIGTINAPRHPETENLFNAQLIAKMKRGACLVNTARGKIRNRENVAAALKSGQLEAMRATYGFPQPPPKDHPWRSMPHHGIEKRPIREQYPIVDGGTRGNWSAFLPRGKMRPRLGGSGRL